MRANSKPGRLIKTAVVVFTAAVFTSGCGKGDGAGGESPIAATLNYIAANGFPKLADLMPALPSQLARIPGVETDESGLPIVPDNLGGATFGDSTAKLNAVLGEAQQLSVQGFSESRRLEAMVLNLAGPIYDVLGRSDLFAATGGATANGDVPAEAMALLQGSDGGSAASIFDNLRDVLSYAVDTGGEDGMPSFVVLGADPATASIDISGLWPEGKDYLTGFHAKVRLNAIDDMEVTLTMAPGTLTGLIPQWKAQSCADDLWQVSIKALPEGKSLNVQSLECPGARNALSSIEFAKGGDDNWAFRGGFAQSFPDASADSLRGFLGARQGFVVQAAASPDLDKLAAAAAVLGESDFAEPTQASIDEFGVGQLVARFFQAKYFTPRQVKAKNAGTFDLDKYENVAYWTCYAPTVASTIKNEVPATKDLCTGKTIDIESALGALTSLNNAIKGNDLAPSDVKKSVKALVDILTIRNTLFVGSEGDLAYKVAPDDAFQALDDSRKSALPAALGDTLWKEAAQGRLARLTAAEIPDTPLKALTKGLNNFLKVQCASIAADAAEKAGKSADDDACPAF